MHEMITGEAPFDTWDYEEALKGEPRVAVEPPQLAELIRKMLSPRPADRPAAEEVRSALLRMLLTQGG